MDFSNSRANEGTTSCTITVSDTGPGAPLMPPGSATYFSNRSWTFAPAVPCVGSGSGTSFSCAFTYTASNSFNNNGTHNLTGSNALGQCSASNGIYPKDLPCHSALSIGESLHSSLRCIGIGAPLADVGKHRSDVPAVEERRLIIRSGTLFTKDGIRINLSAFDSAIESDNHPYRGTCGIEAD